DGTVGATRGKAGPRVRAGFAPAQRQGHAGAARGVLAGAGKTDRARHRTRPVSEAELAGLPDSARAILAQAAQEKQQPGWLATLKGPAVQAVLTFADNRALRETVYAAYNTRASEQGPGD